PPTPGSAAHASAAAPRAAATTPAAASRPRPRGSRTARPAAHAVPGPTPAVSPDGRGAHRPAGPAPPRWRPCPRRPACRPPPRRSADTAWTGRAARSGPPRRTADAAPRSARPAGGTGGAYQVRARSWRSLTFRGAIVVVRLVRGEPHALVQRTRARVVVLHLKPCRRGPLVQRATGQRGHHGGRQALPPPRRIRLDRRESGPPPVHGTPSDGGGRRTRAVRHRGEPHRGTALQ